MMHGIGTWCEQVTSIGYKSIIGIWSGRRSSFVRISIRIMLSCARFLSFTGLLLIKAPVLPPVVSYNVQFGKQSIRIFVPPLDFRIDFSFHSV